MTSLKEIEQKALHAVEYGEVLRPARDWFVLLSIAAVLILISAAWNVWVFVQAGRGEPVGAQVEAPGGSANAIERAQALFEARRLEDARYRSEYQFVDPS